MNAKIENMSSLNWLKFEKDDFFTVKLDTNNAVSNYALNTRIPTELYVEMNFKRIYWTWKNINNENSIVSLQISLDKSKY